MTHAVPECVAVLPFANFTDASHAGDRLAEEVAHALIVRGHSQVLEPAEAVLRLRETLPSTPVSAERAAELGRRLGAAAVLAGSVTGFGWENLEAGRSSRQPLAGISLRLIDVATAHVVWASHVAAFESLSLTGTQPLSIITREAARAGVASLWFDPAGARTTTAICWATR